MPSRQYGLLQVLQQFITTLPSSIDRYKRISTALETSRVDSEALQAVVHMTFKGTQKQHTKGQASVSKQGAGKAEASDADLKIQNTGHDLPESPEEARLLVNTLTNGLQKATLVRLCRCFLGILLTLLLRNTGPF